MIVLWRTLLLGVPDRSGFLNLFPHLSLENGNTLVQGDFIISGTSSQKAAEEASALDISVHSVLGNRSFPNKSLYRFNSDTFRDALCFSPSSKFIYSCQNEIIQGFKVPYQIIPEQASLLPQYTYTCDMTLNFLIESIDMDHFDLIFAAWRVGQSCQISSWHGQTFVRRNRWKRFHG